MKISEAASVVHRFAGYGKKGTHFCRDKANCLLRLTSSGVASTKIWEGKKFWRSKMFDFGGTTLFCLEKRFSKHKMTIFSKNFFWGPWPLWPPWLRLCSRRKCFSLDRRQNTRLSLLGWASQSRHTAGQMCEIKKLLWRIEKILSQVLWCFPAAFE